MMSARKENESNNKNKEGRRELINRWINKLMNVKLRNDVKGSKRNVTFTYELIIKNNNQAKDTHDMAAHVTPHQRLNQ